MLVVASAVVIGFLAKGMLMLIDLITNLCFHGSCTLEYVPPGHNQLGWWIVLMPTFGGVVVGLLSLAAVLKPTATAWRTTPSTTRASCCTAAG